MQYDLQHRTKKAFRHRSRGISVSLKRHSLLRIHVSLDKHIPGTAHSKTRQSWGNTPSATAPAWFRSGWFYRWPYHSCLPCLTARGYHACSRDVSNSRAAHNWRFNYHSIQFKHSELWIAPLGRGRTHQHFCLLCNTNQALRPGSEQRRMRNLWKNWSPFCSKHFPGALT